MFTFFSFSPVFWLVLMIVLLIVEGMTVTLVSIWFAIGAAAALLVSLLTDSALAQASAFVIVSALTLFFTKPFVDRFRVRASTATNGDRNIGRVATALTPISPEHPGRVRLDGVDWAAHSAGGAVLAAGARCRVVNIESTVLYVVPEDAPAQAGPSAAK